jgi:hypothetical protein
MYRMNHEYDANFLRLLGFPPRDDEAGSVLDFSLAFLMDEQINIITHSR